MKAFVKLILYTCLTIFGTRQATTVQEQAFVSTTLPSESGSSPTLGATRVSLDITSIKEWSKESSYPCPPPFKATYSKDGKVFEFIATAHVNGRTRQSDPRLALIKQQVEEFKPQAIVIERPVKEGRFSGYQLDAEWKACSSNAGKFRPIGFRCGEPTYAAIAAARLGAIVVGGEEFPEERNKNVLTVLSREELLLYNSAWILSSMRDARVSLSERKSKFMESLNRQIQVDDSEWSYSKFDNWLAQNIGQGADEAEIQWIRPSSDPDASPLQKIAKKYDSVREFKIVKTVEKVINSRDKVMVVYGAGHYVKQGAVYAKAFGIPKIHCLSGEYPVNPQIEPRALR